MSDKNKAQNNEVTCETGLASAPLSVKIAVDLIQLLEENQLPLDDTIAALEIVLKDFKKKKKLLN